MCVCVCVCLCVCVCVCLCVCVCVCLFVCVCVCVLLMQVGFCDTYVADVGLWPVSSDFYPSTHLVTFEMINS